MSEAAKQKPVDITKSGPMTFRQLRNANDNALSGLSPEFLQFSQGVDQVYAPVSLYNAGSHAQQDIMSPLSQQQTYSGNQDYWGRSHYDNPSATEAQFSQLGDIRAENQPWYSKILNGIGKAGVLAGTTALETAGLLYGAGHSLLEEVGAIEDDNKSWVQNLWDNPITNALQKVTEASEELMPNYYTQDEIENPFSNIFTANFLGDKLLKNFGFMVGAFYGGMPAASLMGKMGIAAVKGARAASLAERAGMARRVGELTAKYGDDAVGLERALAREGLTEAERGKRILEGFDRVRDVAQATRATTQTIGSLGSAINEGAIEALNNSKDWAKMATQQENERYQTELQEEFAKIDAALGGTEIADAAKYQKRLELAEKHAKQLEEIEKGRAKMGNADLLLNIPVLMMSNMYQLGKLYTRGFDSTRRQMGSLWNGHRLSGDLAKGTLGSSKTWKGALGTALLKSNTEGLEEYLQRAASDGAGQAVNDSIQRFFDAGQNTEAKTNVDDYIVGFGKAIADNFGDPNAWEEYMIGALSSMIGMPVFGSQTKNAYMKLGPVGFAGGVIGNYNDYMDAKNHESDIANYLNGRVKDPKFKALYDNLKKQQDYDKWLQEEMAKGDKSKYKDLELESFYKDLNAAASSGHLEEFKQLVGYNQDYTDEELEDIVKQTSTEITPEQQKKQDENRKTYLEGQIAEFNKLGRALTPEESKVYDELAEVNKRLEEDNYQKKLEGPFIDRNGQMNVTNPDKMREILDRNRQNLLQGIDEYLKIRNDIDIETDGRLEDKDIEALTMLRGHILDYDKRSAEMTHDLINNLKHVKDYVDIWKEKGNNKVKKVQEAYDKAKTHWEAVKNGKHNEEYKKKVEKELLDAENKLKEEKYSAKVNDDAVQLVSWLLEEKDTTAGERVAEAKGYGSNIFERIAARFRNGEQRKLNADEVLTILANPFDTNYLSPRVETLARLIMMTPELENSTKLKLMEEVVDLGRLAKKKLEYRKKVREFLGDPSLLNDAYQQHQDKLSQKERDNKSDELSLNIKNAGSMADLDRIMTEAYNFDSEIAKAALVKAKQTSDKSTKKFIEDYEKAVDFRGNFSRQAMKLPENIAASILGTAANEWEKALEEGVDVQDKFIEGMTEAAEDFDREGLPIHKEIAAGIRQVLSTLNAAKSSTATNKETRKSTKKGNDVEDKEKGENPGEKKFGNAAKILAARKAKQAEENNKKEGTADTKDSLQKAVEQEVKDSKQKNGSYKIDDLKKLSKELQDRIQKYNEENPGSEFLVDFEQLLQDLTNEDISKDEDLLGDEDINEDDTDLGDDDDGSDRAEKMHENLRVTFKSDNPTAFRLSDGNVWLDYRIPYEPTVEELMENNPKLTERQAQELKNRIEAIHNLLIQYKAYQFVDNNYLGYVARALDGEPVTVHLLRSTDDTLNKDKTHPITFLAIEWNDKVKNATVKYGFNGQEAAFKNDVNPVTINGKQYHIVGVMSLNGQVAPEVSQAFASLQGALNQELNSQIEEAKANNQPFVVSEKTTVINKINTGRLDKRNDKDDDREKVSLYEFMTSQQGDNTRATSSEWGTGMDFYFGTVVNGMLNTIEDEQVQDQIEEPNSTWMKNNNGAIVMFIPKADGMLYPVRVTRRTVADWLAANADGNHNGRQLLNAVLDGSVKNEYLENIISYLKDIYDEEATISDKMTAKMMLQKYFILGKTSPVHFNGGDITLQFENREYDINGDTFGEFATAFFDVLAKENIKFTLPAASIEEVDGRDVITSGVFEIGLRGFYNFNANFTIVPIDGTGNPVVVESSSGADEHFTGGDNIRGTEMKLDLGDGMQTYIIQGDNTVTLNGKPVSTEKQNLVILVRQAEQGSLPQLQSEQLDARFGKSPNAKKFVSEGVKGFEKVYIIHAEEDWVYDGRKPNHNERLYKLNSTEGTKLMNQFNQAVADFIQNNRDKVKELKKEGAPAADVSTSRAAKVLSDGMLIPSKEGDPETYTLDVQDGKNVFYPTAPVAQLRVSANQSSFFETGRSTAVPGKAGGYVVYEPGEYREEKGAIIVTKKAKIGFYKNSPEELNEVPVEKPKGNVVNEGQETPKMFDGKTLDDLDAKNGGLEALLVANKKSPIVKGTPEKKGRPARMGVWEALQMADSIGKPIDKDDVERKLRAIFDTNKDSKAQMLADLVHEITCG